MPSGGYSGRRSKGNQVSRAPSWPPIHPARGSAMRQNGQMKSDQIAISGASPVVSMRGPYRRPGGSVPAMADLLVCGDLLLASAHASPLARGGVLLRDGAVAEVGERDALARAHPGAQVIGGDGKPGVPGPRQPPQH